MSPAPRELEGAWHSVPLRRAAAAVVGSVAAALCLAAATGASTGHAASRLVVSTERTHALGTILVSGRTLYTLEASATSCGTKCLAFWPPLLLPKGVTRATAGPGVNAAKLGTVTRRDGSRQVTYAGHALYLFFKDTAPGQVKGNHVKDTWGVWSVVSVTTSHKSPPSTTTTKPPVGATTTTAVRPTTTTSTTTTTTAGGGGGGVGF